MLDRDSLKETVERLEGLAASLRQVIEHGMPTAASLHGAPMIDDWSIIDMPKKALTGRIYSHPHLGISPRGIGVTSDLYLIDTTLGVARTMSRWYRLGGRHVSR